MKYTSNFYRNSPLLRSERSGDEALASGDSEGCKKVEKKHKAPKEPYPNLSLTKGKELIDRHAELDSASPKNKHKASPEPFPTLSLTKGKELLPIKEENKRVSSKLSNMHKTLILLLTLFLLPLTTQGQYFNVFDIDTSDYPTMRAKFYSIDENGDQILNHTLADFEITENGEQREVVDVSCPEPKNEPVSVVLAIDVSGSMEGERIELAKEAARSWVKGMPENGSECAIISFTGSNNFIQDFTSNKTRLLNKINNLNAGGGTSFDAAFTDKMAGALLTMDKAKNNLKAVILITDGAARGDESNIINKANSIDSKVFSVTLDMECPDILKNISEKADGEWYENVTTEEQARDVFSMISQEIQNDPCEIVWESTFLCDTNITLNTWNKIIDEVDLASYTASTENTIQINIEPSFINFGEVEPSTSKDTTIKITSKRVDIEINDIVISNGSDVYRINETFPIYTPKGETKKISVHFEPTDSLRYYTTFDVVTNYCKQDIAFYGGFNDKPLSQKTLELTHPNGGEVFYAGSDTIVTWKGISTNDTVSLEFSSDNGETWDEITKNASNHIYNWEVPLKTSNACLIRISQSLNESFKKVSVLEWEKSFGGSSEDIAYSIQQTNDSGYIIAGSSNSIDGDRIEAKGKNDYWILKLREDGELEWEKSFGGSNEDKARSIKQTKDGGYIIAGYSRSIDKDITAPIIDGESLYWILKLKKDGSKQWDKSFGGTHYENPHSIQQTQDGGYIVAGWSKSQDRNVTYPKGKDDYWILKLREDGELEWEKSFGGTSSERAYSIQQTKDGGYIVAGYTESKDGDITKSKGGRDYWILKLNENGELNWNKSYGGSGIDVANSIKQTSDNGYIVAGYTDSRDGDITEPDKYYNVYNYWILKLREDGELEWEKSFGGTSSEHAYSIQQTKDGGYIISGGSISKNEDVTNPKGEWDYWILKLREDGKLEWEKSFGGTSSEHAYSIQQIKDGGYIVAGYTESKDGDINNPKGEADYWIVKITVLKPLQSSDTSDAVFSIIAPEPRIQNNDIDLGKMVVGKTKDTMVTAVLCNDGEAPLHVLGVNITSGDESEFLIPRGAGEFTLNEGECQAFMFEFTPSQVGNRTAYATIRTTIGDFQDTIKIRGEGINPQLQVQAEIVDFGEHELGNSKDTSVVLIENIGVEDITITNTVITGPDKEQFEITDNELSFTLAPNDPKEVSLRYTANYGGRTSSMLAFEYGGVDSPVEAQLYAEGIGGEVYPEIEDGYAGEVKDLKLQLGRIKPEGITEIASTFTATVKFNSTLIAPLDKSVFLEIDDENRTVLEVEGTLSNNTLLTSIPVKIGLGNSIKTSIIVTDFQLYDERGDSVFYDIEPGIGEFNMLGICEEGGTRLINPNGRVSLDPPAPNMTSYQTEIRFETIESGHTKLEVYNFLGSKVATIINGDIVPGRREMTLDLSDFATGRYYIQLSTPTVTKTEILEVVK